MEGQETSNKCQFEINNLTFSQQENRDIIDILSTQI